LPNRPAVPKEFFGTVTAYATLSNQQKETLVSGIKATDEYFPLTTALEPLVSLYLCVPSSISLWKQGSHSNGDAIDQHQVSISWELFDKHSKPAVSMFANAVLHRTLHGLELQNRPQEANSAGLTISRAYPKTERSRGVAAMVRATSYFPLGPPRPTQIGQSISGIGD